MSSSYRKAGGIILVSVPSAILVAAASYRENHRPCLPANTIERDITGKTCVISGATSGIGLSAAIQLAERGAFVVIGSRDRKRGETAALKVRPSNTDGGAVQVLPLDLSDPSSIDDFVNEVRKKHGTVDLFVSAAAEIHHAPVVTEEGVDATFATNHLGLQRLAMGMEPALLEADGIEGGRARVVVIGSRLENKGKVDPEVLEESGGRQLRAGPVWDNALEHYSDTKLANQLLSKSLSQRWRGSVDVVSVTPGMVNTGLWRHFPLWYRFVTYPLRAIGLRTPEDAARGVVFAAVAGGVRNGSYLSDGLEIEPSERGRDGVIADQLFKVCQGLPRQ